MICKHCGLDNGLASITQWPWHCGGCGVSYQSESDEGSRGFILKDNQPRHDLPCLHLGKEARREKCITSCKGAVQIKVFQCELHGECSLAPSSARYCPTCEDYMRYRQPSILNCCYHVYASKSNDLWMRNIRQLLKRKDVFTGNRVAAIASDENSEHPNLVKREFVGSGFECIEFENDKQLREVATFVPLLSTVESLAPYEATFYAHTKGNSTKANALGALYWRNAMYHHLLDRASECMEKLCNFPAVGTHKMMFGKPENAPYPSKLIHGDWMFAGTFFWFRNDVVFAKPNWRDVPKDRYGAEAWLSGLLFHGDGFSMFQPWAEHKYPTPNPYNPALYKQPISDADVVSAKRIGLDLDRTIYSFPDFFRKFIPDAVGRGHKLYCLSSNSRNWTKAQERIHALSIDPAMLDGSLMTVENPDIDCTFEEFATAAGIVVR